MLSDNSASNLIWGQPVYQAPITDRIWCLNKCHIFFWFSRKPIKLIFEVNKKAHYDMIFMVCCRYAESSYNQQQQCMLPSGLPAHHRQFGAQLNGAAPPPPTYEEHVMHYPGADRMHYPQYHPAVMYSDYDPEGKREDNCSMVSCHLLLLKWAYLLTCINAYIYHYLLDRE